jgi:hypothetical protein
MRETNASVLDQPVQQRQQRPNEKQDCALIDPPAVQLRQGTPEPRGNTPEGMLLTKDAQGTSRGQVRVKNERGAPNKFAPEGAHLIVNPHRNIVAVRPKDRRSDRKYQVAK